MELQILAPLNHCDHGSSLAVTPGHGTKPRVCNWRLAGTRKRARKPSLGKFPLKNVSITLICDHMNLVTYNEDFFSFDHIFNKH